MGRTSSPALAGVSVVVSLVLVACGPPSHQYVRNAEQRTAFKLPRDWTLFDEEQMLGETQEAAAGTPDPREWLVGFDADPRPSVEHVLGGKDGNFATDYPTGIAAVLRLTDQMRDQVSFGNLRNLLFPIDPIAQQLGSDAVRILEYDDQIVKDGYRGIHLEFQVREAALSGEVAAQGQELLDDTFLQVSQTAYFDQATERVFVLAVMCSAECFARNRGEIEAAVNSWTVLP